MNALLNLFKLIPCSIGSLTAVFLTFFYVPSLAQIAVGGQVNFYTAVNGFDACGNKITVETTAGFQPGNVVLLMKMQGAEINDEGNITNLDNTGNYEKAVIAEIQENTITFTKDLLKSYEGLNGIGKVQMVKILSYPGNIIVRNELTAQPWNGSTGGILAVESTGTIELEANINVDGKGFKGGAITNNTASRCGELAFRNVNGYVFSSTDWQSAIKGEGIAAIIPGREAGRGAQANGGGGGNDHNSGGGGGGNFGAGGIGGENDEPNFFNCHGYYPGLGGRGINQAETMFMGGGGGGGHTNNQVGTPGGNGGGIIYIKANNIIGNDKVISSNGLSALPGYGDGSGGGGGGGVIMLDIANVNTQNLTIEAKGGNGGNTNNNSGNLPDAPANRENRCFGPGGGGGGGVIAISTAFDPTETAINGGLAGITFNSLASCNGSTNGGLPGGNGTVIQSVFMPTGLLDPGSGCFTPTPVEYIYFTVKGQNSQVYLEWATAREKNNDYFSIERSENGKDFYEIAQVSGKGTYNDVSTYRLTDDNPIYGVSYYRIKQVDYDRKSAYTGIEPVKLAAGEVMMSIFPNPIQNQQNLNVNLFSPVAGEATLRIYTLLGDEKYAREYSVIRGAQTLELPIENFAAGWYVVHIQVGNSYKTQKINVVR